MIEAPRETVSLSRPPAAETPRHLQKPCDQSGTVDETTDLKALARLALARASPRSTNPDGMARGFQTELARPTQTVSGVSVISPVSPVSGVSLAAASWTDAEEERVAIVEYDGGAPRAWAEALTRLDPARPPCDMPFIRWLRFIDDCGRFLDDGWAACAEGLGWGPLDLFGCDRTKPFARINRAGLLWLLNGRRLLALAADTAAIATASGGYLTFRRRFREPGGVLAWELPHG
jgi:hypothetical protein